MWNNLKLSNRYNAYPEEPSVTTSKVIIGFELQLIRIKNDVNKLFVWHIIMNKNSFNNFLLDNNIEYVSGTYQGLIFPVADLQY